MTVPSATLTPALRSSDDRAIVYLGDCLDVLRAIPSNSVHAVITDPPYGLSSISAKRVTDAVVRWAAGDREFIPDAKGFMDESWDAFVPPPAVWDECLRILKPGGHLLAFAGTRTVDLMGLSIRMAGFDIRDSLAWIYGSGMPKSLNVAKAIEATLAADSRPEDLRRLPMGEDCSATSRGHVSAMSATHVDDRTDATDEYQTEEARQWDGWGTSLKPAVEPIVMARKPLESTVAKNTLAHGVGGLNIGATRIDGEPVPINRLEAWSGFGELSRPAYEQTMNTAGRFPANVFFDESQAAALDEQTGITSTTGYRSKRSQDATVAGTSWGTDNHRSREYPGEKGGASRFFYVAKPSKSERPVGPDGTRHPTVKPLALMRQLARLITPADGTIVDPFAGSGTTVEAAILEGFQILAAERGPDFIPLIDQRMKRSSSPSVTAC